MVLHPGDSFAGYTIERQIGHGGMGEVYLARHPTLPRYEALKVLPADLSRDPMFRQRFTREAEHASAIVHPAIVTIYNSGESDSHLWLSMEYIDGVDASELVRSRPQGLDPGLVVAIATAVGSALDAAHEHGLLHRDVKPANILVAGTGGKEVNPASLRVLLADFGIAKSTTDVTHLTAANMFLGTVTYVAPEQLLSTDIDGRADQYSLAATLFQLLCGRPPFESTTQAAVIAAHLNMPPPPPSLLRPGLPPGLDVVFDRALAKRPEDRYRSCGVFAAEVARALEPGPTRVIVSKAKQTIVPERGGTSGPGRWALREPDRQSWPSMPAAAQPVGSGPPARPMPNPGSRPLPQAAPSQQFAAVPVPQYYVPPVPSQPGLTGGHPGVSGGYPQPVPRRSGRNTALAVIAVLVALVGVIVAGIWVADMIAGSSDRPGASVTPGGVTTAAGASSFTRQPVTESPTVVTAPGQINVGNCLQIGRQRDSRGNVTTTKVDCATAALTFYATQFLDSDAECTNEHNASLTFGGSSQKLCLTPNFFPGDCYQIPSAGGSLSDYHEVGCGDGPAANTVILRAVNRGEPAIDCAAGEVRWSFESPSLGYCLQQI
ncbi:MAG: protein kinase [Gordonia sp. (in: high G+C Gram-positive bacteria)]